MDDQTRRSLGRFVARLDTMREGDSPTPERLPRPRLVAVTAENAATFAPTPKRRGRPAKVQLGGAVVALRAKPAGKGAPRPETPEMRVAARMHAHAIYQREMEKAAADGRLDPAIDWGACLEEAWELIAARGGESHVGFL